MSAKQTGAVARRVIKFFDEFYTKDYESALVHLAPAIDVTAEARRPGQLNKSRMVAFFNDEEAFCSFVTFRNTMSGNIYNGKSFGDAMYLLFRNAIAHDGEVDAKLQFVSDGPFTWGGNAWTLPHQFVVAMAMSVVRARENVCEQLSQTRLVRLQGNVYNVDDWWGVGDNTPAPLQFIA